MRLFAAIELPETVINELNDWWCVATTGLDMKQWRPVSPHLWHVTLAFYGDVSGHDADDLAEALLECADSNPSLILETDSFGFFPGPARPRVFWAGVHDQKQGGRLKHLAHCCRRAGHATVRKRTAKESAFRGHITVARGRDFPDPINLADMLLLAEVPLINWRAGSLSLFQSILQPDGPQYRRLETFELKGSTTGTRGKHVR